MKIFQWLFSLSAAVSLVFLVWILIQSAADFSNAREDCAKINGRFIALRETNLCVKNGLILDNHVWRK